MGGFRRRTTRPCDILTYTVEITEHNILSIGIYSYAVPSNVNITLCINGFDVRLDTCTSSVVGRPHSWALADISQNDSILFRGRTIGHVVNKFIFSEDPACFKQTEVPSELLDSESVDDLQGRQHYSYVGIIHQGQGRYFAVKGDRTGCRMGNGGKLN